MDSSLSGKTIDTGITSSHGEVVKIRHCLIDNFVGKWDEVGIELLNEKEKKFTGAVWIYRKDLPKLIAELQKFV